MRETIGLDSSMPRRAGELAADRIESERRVREIVEYDCRNCVQIAMQFGATADVLCDWHGRFLRCAS